MFGDCPEDEILNTRLSQSATLSSLWPLSVSVSSSSEIAKAYVEDLPVRRPVVCGICS